MRHGSLNKYHIRNYLISFILFGVLQATASGNLTITYSGAGFFSCFFGVLNNLRWCEQNNKNPIVFWGSNSLYYSPLDFNGSENVWEYYFEPVSSKQKSSDNLVYAGYLDPDGYNLLPAHIFPDQQKRVYVHTLIKKYIHIKQPIKDKIDTFYNQFMANKKTIGIHLRGTDKGTEVPPVSPYAITREANKYAELGYQFFVATDEVRLLKIAQETLQGQVIFYDSIKSDSNKPLHLRSFSKAKLGEDVLIESQILSRCDILIHTRSNVSFSALFFNPRIVSICLE